MSKTTTTSKATTKALATKQATTGNANPAKGVNDHVYANTNAGKEHKFQTTSDKAGWWYKLAGKAQDWMGPFADESKAVRAVRRHFRKHVYGQI